MLIHEKTYIIPILCDACTCNCMFCKRSRHVQKIHFIPLIIQGGDDPFVIGDLGDIVKKYRLWIQTLPRVQPFYGTYQIERRFLK